MAKNKSNISTSTKIFVILVLLLMIVYSVYQGVIENMLNTKAELKKEIKVLHSQYVEISTKLQNMQLEGSVKKEIQRRGLNLTNNDIPKVIYVEPEKER